MGGKAAATVYESYKTSSNTARHLSGARAAVRSAGGCPERGRLSGAPPPTLWGGWEEEPPSAEEEPPSAEEEPPSAEEEVAGGDLRHGP